MEENLKKQRDIIKAIMSNFSKEDVLQITNYGLNLEKIEQELTIFRNGIPKIALKKPATLLDGILLLSEEQFIEKAKLFDTKKSNLKLEKFVPASGAASRMFQFLSEFLNTFDIKNETINSYINKNNATSFTVFLAGMEKFPFFDEVHQALRNAFSDFDIWHRDQKNYYFVKFLIGSAYFNFANKPKGVLPFHKYENYIATPIEEHLQECVNYASSNNEANLHFTISDEHQEEFETILSDIKTKIELENNVKINTSFSYQNKKTNTIAVDFENNPLRDADNKLVFRPGGHGALIENLNQINADIIFIKNIDNVIKNNIETIGLYKKGLASILIETQEVIFGILKNIENQIFAASDFEKTILFAKNKLNINFNSDFDTYSNQNKIEYIKSVLNKPIRVCGMVKNENEPGGGPFWVLDKNENTSLQIVESAQVDLSNQQQKEILNSASHFNPVDLVCGTKNYLGTTFDLSLFVDHNSGFIVEKNKNGQDLKGYELPGLWNGAMANWLTIFVEVPLVTFNPVKTVNDLLKPTHQD